MEPGNPCRSATDPKVLKTLYAASKKTGKHNQAKKMGRILSIKNVELKTKKTRRNPSNQNV